MDWNCVLTEERLSDHLDGLLSPAEAAAFSVHVAGCEQCGKLVAQVGGLVNSMQRLEPLEAPPQLVTKILDATLGPRTQKQSWRRWFTWIPVLWQPRFTMGVATVVATLLIVIYTTGLSPAKLKSVGPESSKHVSRGQPASAPDLRAQRQIRERPARGLRNPVAPAAGHRAAAVAGARSRTGTESGAAAFHEPTGEIAGRAASGAYAGTRRRNVCRIDGRKLDGVYRWSDSQQRNAQQL